MIYSGLLWNRNVPKRKGVKMEADGGMKAVSGRGLIFFVKQVVGQREHW